MKKTTKKTKRKTDDVNVMAFDIVNEMTAEKPVKAKKQKRTRKTTRKTPARSRKGA